MSLFFFVVSNSHFLFRGLRTLLPHFLHLTIPRIIFILGDFSLDLHLLHTNTFLNLLASASGNLTIFSLCINYLFTLNLLNKSLVKYYPIKHTTPRYNLPIKLLWNL